MPDFLSPDEGWITGSAVRLPPPPPNERGLPFRAISGLSSLFGRPQLPDVFPVLNTHRGLFWAWLWFASRLMPFGKLSGRERELLILRTGWNCRSRYEWGQHVEIGQRAGLTDRDIQGIARGAAAWPAGREHTLITVCDEICTHNTVSDASWQALSAHYSPKLCVEILMLVGHYRMIAGLLNTAGIALEAPLEANLQALHDRLAAAPPR